MKAGAVEKKVENDYELPKVSLKKSWRGFYKHILEQVVACESFFLDRPEQSLDKEKD